MKRNDPNRYDTSTIKPRRLAAGLTQMKLAAAVGVELNTLRSWEKDWNAPNPENAARLDAVLDQLKQEPRRDCPEGMQWSDRLGCVSIPED